MARLIELKAEDFCLFESLFVDLEDQGLVFIGGEDHDTDAADSNGSGKSTIFKALSWGLYGKTIDGEEGDKVIRHGTKCARVQITLDDDGERYVITRERRKQSPKLSVKLDDKPIDKSKVDLQTMIDNLIGVDWEGFRNTVLYGQNDTKRFVYPATKDSTRKDILHRILRTGVFKFCHEEALKRNRELKTKETKAQTDIDNLSERIADFDLDELQKRVDLFDEQNRKRVRKLANEARELADKAKAAKDGPDLADIEAMIAITDEELEVLKVTIAESKTALERAEDQRAEVQAENAKLEAAYADAESKLKLLKGSKCPTCTGPLTKGHGAAHKADLKAARDKAAEGLELGHKARQTALQARQAAKTALTSQEAERDHLTGLRTARAADLAAARATAARAADLARQARDKADLARSTKSQENPHQRTLSESKEKVRELKRRRKAAKAELKDVSLKRSAVEFWTRGFGPSGLPSFVLDATMPYLTERANHYLETLSDGDITISFSTQRELKSASGEYRDEIGITWTIEGVEDYPPSGGQFKKMEVATTFAMMDLVATREAAHVSLLCLDECLDGLDSQGRQRVIKVLHDLRSSRESIFVISHDYDLAEVFEKSLLVVKENGVSHLQEAA